MTITPVETQGGEREGGRGKREGKKRGKGHRYCR